MKKIICNLNDIDSLKTQLEQYKSELDQKMNEAIQELANKTSEQLKTNYGDIRVAGDNTPPTVTPIINGNSATISAKGENIAFIEFGTGILYPEHPYQNYADGIVARGTYGEGKGSSPNGWWFNSNGNVDTRYAQTSRGRTNTFHTRGNPANMQVYNASKWLRQNYIDIIKGKLK